MLIVVGRKMSSRMAAVGRIKRLRLIKAIRINSWKSSQGVRRKSLSRKRKFRIVWPRLARRKRKSR